MACKCAELEWKPEDYGREQTNGHVFITGEKAGSGYGAICRHCGCDLSQADRICSQENTTARQDGPPRLYKQLLNKGPAICVVGGNYWVFDTTDERDFVFDFVTCRLGIAKDIRL